MTRLREHYLRGTRLWGYELGLIYYPPVELIRRGYKMVFWDLSDVKIGELGSDVKEARVSGVEFELLDFGCGSFSFTIDELPFFDIGYRTRVAIYPYYDEVPWFMGFIQRIPEKKSKKPYKFSGFGFYEQLDWVTVTGSYQSQDISDIVKDIIQNTVAPNTQIVYNAAKIQTVGYTLQSISFDHTFAKDAVELLSSIAQNFVYGIDDQREFFFQTIDTDIKKQFWEGKHFGQDDIESDPTAIRNKLYIKVGQIQTGGSNIIGSVEDSSSINDYGLREDIITAPEVLDEDDAIRWGNYLLSQKKDPTTKAKVPDHFLDVEKVKIEAKGKIKLTLNDGTEYILPVKKVSYKISSSGMVTTIELGTLFIPFEQHLVNMLRKIQEEQRLADQRTKQLAP